MDHTYSSMMSGIPAALAIWLALIGVSAVAFALLAAIAGRGRRRAEGEAGIAIGSAAGPAFGSAAGSAFGSAAGSAFGSAGGSATVGYVPRNEATLRALAAAKAVTADEKPPSGAAQRSKPSRPTFGRPKFTRPSLGRTEASRPEAARPATSRPERDVPAPREPEITEVIEAVEAVEVTEVIAAVEVAEAPRSDEQRFADELATAAARAGVTADRRQAEWESAQRTVDSAWQAFEEAENAAKRAIRAAAFPIPETPLTPAEFADRERYLHRAARAAHARGELSTDQLADALSHRNGFDPRLHQFEQDALLRRLRRDRALRAYQDAAERERTAWREADLALAARSSLDREAAAAARNAAPGPKPASAFRHIRVTTPVLSLR